MSKVKCELCGRSVSSAYLPRHQETNICRRSRHNSPDTDPPEDPEMPTAPFPPPQRVALQIPDSVNVTIYINIPQTVSPATIPTLTDSIVTALIDRLERRRIISS